MRETRTRDGSSAGSHGVRSRLAGGAPVEGGVWRLLWEGGDAHSKGIVVVHDEGSDSLAPLIVSAQPAAEHRAMVGCKTHESVIGLLVPFEDSVPAFGLLVRWAAYVVLTGRSDRKVQGPDA